MRQIILDTETTGLDPAQGHRVIEIGCVELLNRKLTGEHWHCYLNPEREVEEGALAVHGLSDEFLADKPLFENVVDEFLDFVGVSTLVIHNAPFDVGFLNMELRRLKKQYARISARCPVVDTLTLAREKHPGQRNSLDALCKRYEIDNSRRTLHGALLDSQILADVYLAMTGGQASLSLGSETSSNGQAESAAMRAVDRGGLKLVVVAASVAEEAAHQQKLDEIEQSSGQSSVWRLLEKNS